MALQVKIVAIQPAGPNLRVLFNVGVSGNYVTTGDTLDFTQAVLDPSFVGSASQLASSQGPVQLDVWSEGGNIANGVFPVKGSALNNNKVKFTSAFNTELAAGAYPGSITGDQICGEAIFLSKL